MMNAFSSTTRLIAVTVTASLIICGLIVGLIIGLLVVSRTTHDKTCVESLSQPYPSAYGKYRYAGVTCDTKICSQVGTDIMLRHGGSAVDAAIATMLCVGVVNSYADGIGGGHFQTIYARPRGETKKIMLTILGRERAPAFATANMYVNGSASSLVGGKSIGIPGEIRGFYEAWIRFGLLDWNTLFQPAIRISEEGFKIERKMAVNMKNYETQLKNDANLRAQFVKPDGSLKQEGDLVVNMKLGQTLRRIAADPFTFYNGSLAQDIVADIAEYGGNITLEDLNGYQAAVKLPLNVTLNNGRYTLFNPRPPASGAIISYIMSILDGYNLGPEDVCDVNRTVLTYHRITEAFKLAYAKRSQLADEQFVDISTLIANLTSPDYAASARRLIDDTTTHDVLYYKPTFVTTPDHGTTHMNVLAPDGSAVAMTSTNNYYFGSQVLGTRTGILFNDQMDDFSTPGLVNAWGFPASPNNFIEPGKIPQSSMCPTIVLDSSGEVVFMAGGAGGSRITTTTAFVMMNSLWFKKDLKSATDTARIHHQLVPNILYYEPSLDSRILTGLKALNHVTSALDAAVGMSLVNTIRSQCSTSVTNIGSTPALNGTVCMEVVSEGRAGGLPDGF